MNTFFNFLFGTTERKVITSVVVIMTVVYLAPSFGNIKVGFNEDYAAQTDADYCRNTYQVLASRCNADSRCTWDYTNNICGERSVASQCSGLRQWRYPKCNNNPGCQWDTASNVCIVRASPTMTSSPSPTPTSPLLSSLSEIRYSVKLVQDNSCYYGAQYFPVELGTGRFTVAYKKSLRNNKQYFGVDPDYDHGTIGGETYVIYLPYINTVYEVREEDTLDTLRPTINQAYLQRVSNPGTNPYERFSLFDSNLYPRLTLGRGEHGAWYSSFVGSNGTSVWLCSSRWIVDSVEPILE